MNLQDEQHLSNSLTQQNSEKSTEKPKKTVNRGGRPKGVRNKVPKKPREKPLTPTQEREQELALKKQSVAAKRAELTRNVPKVYPAIEEYGLEIAALKAQEKIRRLLAVVGES